MSQTQYDLAFLGYVDTEFSVQDEAEITANAKKNVVPYTADIRQRWVDILQRGKWSD